MREIQLSALKKFIHERGIIFSPALEAVANSPSEFGYLIERAVKDISIAIDKQRLKLIGQIDEYAENSHERELDIEKYTERVEKLKKQNEKLKSSLEHQTYYYDALEGDLKRIQDIAQKPHETTVIEIPAIASKSFVDDLTLPLYQRIEMYTLEKNRLEAQLEMLTNTFQRLDQIKDECIFQLNK